MIDKNRKLRDRYLARISVGIGGAVLLLLSLNAYNQEQLSDSERQAIEARLGGIASAEPSLDDIVPSRSTNEEVEQQDIPEIARLNYELSPIVAINIADGLIKEKKLLKYDWESNYDEDSRVVEYSPESFNDLYVSIEDNDFNGDDEIDERRGRLGLVNGDLQGAVFAFGHTHSNPNIDAAMDKIGEVNKGDTVTAKTESGITYVFTVDDIKLADKQDTDDKAKRCGKAGRIFTCFVMDDSRTDSSVFLCLEFKGIQDGNRTILAK